jgi:RNA polymerase sigma-70 factor (ECF subfamily)
MEVIRNMEELPDDSLVQEAKKDNPDAFTELVCRYQKKIYSTIFQFTRNHHDTDDLAQETFMNAYKSLQKFRQKANFYTWLYRIAVNTTMNFLRKKHREKGREEFVEDQLPSGVAKFSSSSPEYHSLKKELKEKLKEAVDSLPLAYKVTFVLIAFQDMTHGQAARVLRCSEKTVSWRMHKARKILKNKLMPYF